MFVLNVLSFLGPFGNIPKLRSAPSVSSGERACVCTHTHFGLFPLPPCGDFDEVRVCAGRILKCGQIVLHFYQCSMESMTGLLQRM